MEKEEEKKKKKINNTSQTIFMKSGDQFLICFVFDN